MECKGRRCREPIPVLVS